MLAMLELRSCFGFSMVRDRKKNRGERERVESYRWVLTMMDDGGIGFSI